MNTLLTSARHVAFLGALALLPFAASAAENKGTDHAAQLLATHGTVAVTSATRYVERGTFRVQVAAKLGRPDVTLPDGTWLYHRRQIENSDATGTLVVQFASGRVSSLSVVTPAVATAMRDAATGKRDTHRIATK